MFWKFIVTWNTRVIRLMCIFTIITILTKLNFIQQYFKNGFCWITQPSICINSFLRCIILLACIFFCYSKPAAWYAILLLANNCVSLCGCIFFVHKKIFWILLRILLELKRTKKQFVCRIVLMLQGTLNMTSKVVFLSQRKYVK